MTESELKELVVNILEHPLFYDHFHKNGEKIVPHVVILPEIYGINAYAGIENGRLVIKVTKPMFYILNRQEIMGVLAHEVKHLKYKDHEKTFRSSGIDAGFLLLLCIVGTLYFSKAICLTAFILGLVLITKGFFDKLKELEYGADLYGAGVAGKEAMISGLLKIDNIVKRLAEHKNQKNTSPLKCFIGNVGKAFNAFMEYFDTHPNIEERVKNIEEFSK